ncbi:hypothetical protein GCM10023212_07990 [Luteolibacter yonseiensis]
MKLNLLHNWVAKILSLLLATAIWFLIKEHLALGGDSFANAPRAKVVKESEDGEETNKKR